MSKKSKSKPIWFERAMLESKAYLALNRPTSFKVLARFYIKRQVENKNANYPKRKFKAVLDRDGDPIITNNGQIEFTYKECKRQIGCCEGAFRDAIDELVGLGFIDIAEGGFGVDKKKTLYAISKRWRLYGTPEFKKVKRPERPFKVGFQKGNKLGRNCKKKKVTVESNSKTTVDS